MGDIFVALVRSCQAPWWRLKTPGQVSRGAASPTGVFPFQVAAARGPVAVTEAPEAAGDFHVLADAARNPPDPQFTYLKQTRGVCLS